MSMKECIVDIKLEHHQFIWNGYGGEKMQGYHLDDMDEGVEEVLAINLVETFGNKSRLESINNFIHIA